MGIVVAAPTTTTTIHGAAAGGSRRGVAIISRKPKETGPILRIQKT